jgi:hypothetical protein
MQIIQNHQCILCMAVWIENWNVLQRTKLTRLNSLNNDKSRTNRSDVKPAPEVAPVAVEAER